MARQSAHGGTANYQRTRVKGPGTMGHHPNYYDPYLYGIRSEWKGEESHTISYHLGQHRRGTAKQSQVFNTPVAAHLCRGPLAMSAAYAWRMWLSAPPEKTMLGPTAEEIHLGALHLQMEANPDDPFLHHGASFNQPVSSWYCAMMLQREGTFEFPIQAEDVGDIRLWAIHKGPLVLTTPIYEGMMYHPGDEAVIDGRMMGWNDYLVVGWSGTRKAARIMSSEGRDWGDDGRKWLNRYDLDQLLEEGAIAMTSPTKRVGAEAHRARIARNNKFVRETERFRRDPLEYVPFYARRHLDVEQ